MSLLRFDELIGQDMPSAVLQRAVRDDRVSHAYLFTGSEGTGKKTAALAFAAALNCENGTETGDACGECVQCSMLKHEGHPDVEVISPDGAMTKIQQMREMRSTARYAPVRGRFRVVIVEQADTLNDDSSNCILKILEEPPRYLVLILLSRNPALLLQTIRSRCVNIRFPNSSPELLRDVLVDRFGVSAEEAEFAARYSDGRAGKAIGILQNEGFHDWRKRIADLGRKMVSSNRRSTLRLAEDFRDIASEGKTDGKTQREAVKPVLDALIVWFRDLLNLSIRGDEAVLANADLRYEMSMLEIDANRVLKSIETLLWAKRAIEGNANLELVSDVAVIRMM